MNTIIALSALFALVAALAASPALAILVAENSSDRRQFASSRRARRLRAMLRTKRSPRTA